MDNSKWIKDLGERVFWTAAQSAAGLLTVDALHVPLVWAGVVAAGLAVVKGFIAKHVGNPDSASLTKDV